MDLEEFSQLVPDVATRGHPEKIKLFGWYLHVHKQMPYFQPSDVGACYDTLHIARPSGFGGYFSDLCRPGRGLLKNTFGYRLDSKTRNEFDGQYGSREITIQVTELLVCLPKQIPNLAEQIFLAEALTCFRHKAFRAAIVMTWNLAYHHLCDYVLTNHIADFNKRWLVRFPKDHKDGPKAVVKMDDFGEELKESKVIEICKSAGIITNDVYKILDDKLGRRNSAAHPSGVVISQLQAEEFIHDLISNVVLKLV